MLLIAFGDIHMDLETVKRIPEIEEADYVVLTGDLTVNGGRRDAEKVLNSVSEMNSNLYAQIGNMDRKDTGCKIT